MRWLEVRGGGPLDGDVMPVPPDVDTVSTTGGCWYAIDSDRASVDFAGHGSFGREASMIIRHQREQSAQDRQAVLEASQPRSCPACGSRFADHASLTVHRDPSQGCLPGDAYGQLEESDGVWRRIGTAAR
jgi:hypothetical protein